MWLTPGHAWKKKYRHIPWNRYNLEKYRDINFWSYRPALLDIVFNYTLMVLGSHFFFEGSLPYRPPQNNVYKESTILALLLNHESSCRWFLFTVYFKCLRHNFSFCCFWKCNVLYWLSTDKGVWKLVATTFHDKNQIVYESECSVLWCPV